MDIGHKIKQLRIQNGLTLEELASRSELTFWRHWEALYLIFSKRKKTKRPYSRKKTFSWTRGTNAP